MLHEIGASFLRVLYPQLCLHCEQQLDKHTLFCPDCLGHLALLDPAERCRRCFSEILSPSQTLCRNCRQSGGLIFQTAAAFDYLGPAAALIKQLKYGGRPYLAKGAGAFLVAQWANLGWPVPDAIIPVPLTFGHWWERGYNQSALLADVVAKALDKPMLQVLQRASGDFSHAGLSQEQRRQKGGKAFSLRKGTSLHDQCLLLVDDVMTTGSTLQQCAEALLEGIPASIYALTVCKAIE